MVHACAIDWKVHRLPNPLVLRSAIASLLGIAIASLLLDQVQRLRSSIACAFLALIAMLALHLLSRGQLGFGDVKFAFPCGALLGWFAVNSLLLWLWVSFLLAALYSGWKLVTGGRRDTKAIAFGPFMLLSLCAVILLAR